MLIKKLSANFIASCMLINIRNRTYINENLMLCSAQRQKHIN